MNNKLDIIIEMRYVKHLCEAYQDETDKATKEELWRVIMVLVRYLSDAVKTI
jgi:hypothetical protein